MRRNLAVLSMLTAGLAAPVGASAQTTPAKTPYATGKGGAVATVDKLASRAAMRILRDGGNAVDAAVAAAGVLGVTEPFSCGIGGGGFMVVYDARKKTFTTLDHREQSPRAMTPTSFWENGRPLPFSEARFSGMSAGVPGTAAAWERALRRFGSMSMRRVLRPAIRVAEKGFVVDQTFFDQTQGNVPWFDDFPATRALYLDPDGTPRDVGTRLRNPDLARTYRRLARRGAERGFYEGPVARAIVDTVRQPPVDANADHRIRPGVMTLEDLDRYRARWRRPTVNGYRNYEIVGMGPPSSGGSTVGEALNILEGFRFDRGRIWAMHHFLEASRFAFADRNAYLADPAFFDVPLRGLLSDSFAAERRALIGPTAARSPVAPGDPYKHEGRQAPTAAATAVTAPGGSTTHLVTSDKRGNVVSYTFTIESTGGNGMVVPGWGFLLNNELTDFNYDSTSHPNRAEGRKRPRSSMAPTIVARDGRPFLAVGSPGGATIITTVLQVLVERLDLKRPIADAIASPRASQRNTSRTNAEEGFMDSGVGPTLAANHGHAFTVGGEIGAVTAIELRKGPRVIAAAEPVRRGGGHALVQRP